MQVEITKEQIRDLFLENEATCSLCGSELKQVHKVDHINQKVTEQSHCNSCGIRNKKRSFVLQ